MELKSFEVAGLRSLARTGRVPLGCPTILTGPNDGGKTSLLDALAFLLSATNIAAYDFTSAREDEDPPCGTTDGHFSECSVEGTFALTEKEKEELQLEEEIHLRRRISSAGKSLEIRTKAPENHALRELDVKNLGDLQKIAEDLEIEADGPRIERSPTSGLSFVKRNQVHTSTRGSRLRAT